MDIISPNKMRGNFWIFKYAVAPLKVHINDNDFCHFNFSMFSAF